MAPPTKRRKVESTAVEEVKFDLDAREEYLTGFHKRKLQRAKHSRELAEKKARVERIEQRKQLREERKIELEQHVQQVNALLRNADADRTSASDRDNGTEEEEWVGIEDPPEVDHEAEYIDEDRYTTVTVEAMDVSKEGLYKAEREEMEASTRAAAPETPEAGTLKDAENRAGRPKRAWSKDKPKDKPDRPKTKRKKFRYESKAARKVTRVKERSKNNKQATERRSK